MKRYVQDLSVIFHDFRTTKKKSNQGIVKKHIAGNIERVFIFLFLFLFYHTKGVL